MPKSLGIASIITDVKTSGAEVTNETLYGKLCKITLGKEDSLTSLLENQQNQELLFYNSSSDACKTFKEFLNYLVTKYTNFTIPKAKEYAESVLEKNADGFLRAPHVSNAKQTTETSAKRLINDLNRIRSAALDRQESAAVEPSAPLPAPVAPSSIKVETSKVNNSSKTCNLL